jgi:FkbM family methyltransferase
MNIDKLFQEAQNLHRKGKIKDARKRYEKILELKSDHGRARLYLAIILYQLGLVQYALENADKAIQDTPHPDANMLSNYGVMLKNAGQMEQAENAYRQALDISPEHHSVKSNLATLYLIRGKYDLAEPMLMELTQVLEESAPWLNLARIAISKDDFDQARGYIQHAEDIDPKQADIFLLRARMAFQEKDDQKAYDNLKRLFDIEPSHREAWLLFQKIDPEVLEPDYLEKLTRFLARTKVQSCSTLTASIDICRKNLIWSPLKDLETLLTEALTKPVDKTPSTSATFTLLGADVPQWGHLKAADLSWKHITRNIHPLTSRELSKRTPLEKIKAGILSSDLRGHATGYLIVGLLENLPGENIEWFAYNNSFSDNSDSRERIRSCFNRFVNVASLNDQELAQKICQDEIDILIDLNGMTRDTRVTVMAYRPAPVQITWLGMPGSTGAGGDIDYVIGDPWVVFEGNVDGFSEKIVQLPRSYQPNDHVPPDLSLAGERADHNLPQDLFVFCCFNQHYKISPDTFRLWTEILKEIDNSVFWLLHPTSESVKESLLRHFNLAGIDTERIIFAHYKPQSEHMARISHADLVLDTWPYNAHTTCSDALRLGVPVLTLPGQTFASRVAAGILETGGLSEWIVSSPEEYVKKAVEFATQPLDKIRADKAVIRDTYWTSKMVDNEAFGKMFEALCLGLYDRAVKSEPVCDLRLTEDLNLEIVSFSRKTIPTVVPDTQGKVEAVIPEGIQNIGRQAKTNNLMILQSKVIGLEHPPLVVDVGAADFDWDEQAFESLVDAGILNLLGFEPDENNFAKIVKLARPNREYEQTAIGNGKEAELRVYRNSHMNSSLEPNPDILEIFGYKSAKVVSQISVKTKTLDEIELAHKAAMIKLDAKGMELDILKHAGQILNNVTVIQLEAATMPMYKKQPSLFELGSWLEQKGFVLHCFAKEKRVPYQTRLENERTSIQKQILALDLVFIPSPLTWESMDTIRLKEMAFIMHAIYNAYDITLRSLEYIDQRNSTDKAQAYAEYLKEAGFNA